MGSMGEVDEIWAKLKAQGAAPGKGNSCAILRGRVETCVPAHHPRRFVVKSHVAILNRAFKRKNFQENCDIQHFHSDVQDK